MSSYFCDHQKIAIGTLDTFDYEGAARVVYGCGYTEWKKRHQKMATEDQM
jgi:hypothetical protein